jgi:hypothetical protein
MLFAEWHAYLGVAVRKEDVAGCAGGTRTAHNADQKVMGSLVQCLDLGVCLFEEEVFSDGFAHVEVLSAFAEAHDPGEKRVVAVLELFHETEPAQLNAKLDYTVNPQYLVVAVFHLSRVGFHLFPIFNNIYQTGFTLTVMQAQFKNILSPQRYDVFVAHAKSCIGIRTYGKRGN